MSDGDRDDYFRAIEEEFVRRREASMLLSPRDWALIGGWQRAGIPLRIVLQGIANVFDAFERRRPGARRINSLAYCRQEVLSLHELSMHLSSAGAGRPAVGEGAAAGNRIVVRHLGRLQRSARLAMAAASESHLDPLVGALALASSELKGLRKQAKDGSLDPGRLEEELGRLDDSVIEAARRSLSEQERADEEAHVQRALATESIRMSPEAFAATRRAHLARRLRARCRLPRLTLFD